MRFKSEIDAFHEALTQVQLEQAWGLKFEVSENELENWDLSSPHGAIELKWRYIYSDMYLTVPMAVRKYDALIGKKNSLFVVHWVDPLIKWIRVTDCTNFELGPIKRINHRADHDTEPGIYIPIHLMSGLEVNPYG